MADAPKNVNPLTGEATTVNYGWTKPTVGASVDAWGGYINSDLDGIDTTVKSISTVANAAYPASNPAGYITAAAIPAPYVLPTASTSVLGGVKVDGSTIAINSGVISAAGASITVSDTPPSTPSAGALWFNSSAGSGGGQLYVFYADPNTSQWVPTTNQMGGGYMPLQGVTNGSDAPAGQIGEYVTAARVSGSAISLTNVTGANVTSISLTAGDWDVEGNVSLAMGGGVFASMLQAWVSSASAASQGAGVPGINYMAFDAPRFSGGSVPTGVARFSLAATTTIYLGAMAQFASGTSSAYGTIRARRAR